MYEKSDHVGVITLNRPEPLNAISFEMLEALTQVLDEADRDDAVRVLILTGAGRGFCSGLDLKDAAAGKGIGGAGTLSAGGGAQHIGTRAGGGRTPQRKPPPATPNPWDSVTGPRR